MEVGALLAGKYRLIRQLGDGGMGSVYEARHEALGTSFAIKILHAELVRRPGLVDRFLQEARVAAQIKSPHVVQVFDVDRTPDGVAYIVMELLGGEPLSRRLDRERRLPVPVALAFTIQILEALESAHALGVVHRDLKPDNIFVVPGPGGGPLLKLIDFGIAKLKSNDPKTKNLTAFGVVMGTPEYMAPEQAFSADRADARSDIYAVGVLLYEMLAGSRPASGDEAQSVAAKVHRGEIVPLVHIAPHVPRELAGLVHRAMAPRPELRFASATEMLTALRATAPQASMAPSPPPAMSAAPLASTSFAPPIPSPMAPGVVTGPAVKTAPPDAGIAVSPAPPQYSYTPAPPPPQISYPDAPPPRRKKKSAIGWIIGVPLVLGAIAAVVIIALQSSGTTPEVIVVPPPTTTPTTPTTVVTPPPTVPTTSDPLPPLVGGGTVPPTGTPTHAPSSRPSSDAGAPAPVDAGPAPSGRPGLPTSPFPLPSGFPSSLPFPLPSAIPLPSGFPAIPSSFPFPIPAPPSGQ